MDIFIDTEFANTKLLEVALVSEHGEILLNTRVRPNSLEFDTTWRFAAKVHGIYPQHVVDAPPAHKVRREVLEICAGHRVLAYFSGADARHFPGIKEVADVVCVAQAFKAVVQSEHPPKLSEALRHAGINWTFGKAHGALADAQAALALWGWIAGRRLEKVLRGLSEDREPLDQGADAPREKTSSAMANQGSAWTQQANDELRDAWLRGDSIATISKALGRTEGGITARLARLGLVRDAQEARRTDEKRQRSHASPA